MRNQSRRFWTIFTHTAVNNFNGARNVDDGARELARLALDARLIRQVALDAPA